MNRIQRIAAITDLSGFGRCSLTVATPILSAMGYQVCPAPTVILSAHTGYPDPLIRDFGDDLAAYLAHWEQLGLAFDAIYTGFIGEPRQAEAIERLMNRAGDGVIRLIDPAMADHGCLYASCTAATVAAMKRLATASTLTTPNLTEACLMAGEDYDAIMALSENERLERAAALAHALQTQGCRAIVITGIPGENALYNLTLDTDGTAQIIAAERVQRAFAGTGDVFAAVLCGTLLQGKPLAEAVRVSADFVTKAAAFTARIGGNEQDGIAFEPFLGELCPKRRGEEP